MAFDTERLIRFAVRFASPGQVQGLICCLMAVGILALVETVLVESDFRPYFSWACVAVFYVGLTGIASPFLRRSFWR